MRGVGTSGKRAAQRKRLGLALGAGGARGLAHLGVLKGLAQAEIPVDAIAGTSIGALVGAIYAAGQLENFERRMLDLEWPDVVRLFDPVWPRSGLMSGDRATEWLAGMLGDWRIEDLTIPFAAVSVDLVTGEEVLITEGRVMDAIRASISIPGIFVPHRRGRQLLVDGALRNPVPVSALDALGAELRVAVNLHSQPVREITRAGRTRSESARPGFSIRVGDAIERSLGRFRQRGRGAVPTNGGEVGPNLFEILTASMMVLEHELARHRLASEPVDVIIAPDVQGIRSLEFHKARRAIAAGRVEVEAHFDEITAQLRKRTRTRRRAWRATSARRG